MLLTRLASLRPGNVVACPVFHPHRPLTELVKPGVKLDLKMIRRLGELDVRELWIEHPALPELSLAARSRLTGARQDVYRGLKDGFGALAQRTVSTADVMAYQHAVMALTCEVISSKKHAGLTDRFIGRPGALLGHSANVAYLSLLIGLELGDYLVAERPRLSGDEATDTLPLAMGALLHDIGKTQLDAGARTPRGAAEPDTDRARAAGPDEAGPLRRYVDHPALGYELLSRTRAPITATQIVLCHHQRFDGAGFPDMTDFTGGRRFGPQVGREIHVFSRIVAAVDHLDHQLDAAREAGRPPIAALHALLGTMGDGRFDPVIVHRLARHLPPFPVGSAVKLSDGRLAVVVGPSLNAPCRPTVRPLAADGSEPADPLPAIDLSNPQHGELSIVEAMGVDVRPWLYELPPTPRWDAAESPSESAA